VAKPPGRCIFCGAYGLTREHVLPDWLRAIFPRLSTDTHTFGSFDWEATPDITQTIAATRNRAQGQVGSKKVRVICKGCNNGWLSQMEQATKPLLEEMVLGAAMVMNASEQRQLAAWIAKTTMTAEFIYPKEVALTQAEREEFRHCGEPGPHWQIWIAFYTGTKQIAGGIFHHGLGLLLAASPNESWRQKYTVYRHRAWADARRQHEYRRRQACRRPSQ